MRSLYREKMDLHPDFRDLLAEFAREKVSYAVVNAPPHLIAAVKKLAANEVVYLGVPPVRVDILRSANGIHDVDATIERAVRASVGDLSVPIIALDDLVTNKRAAGRPQDIADVALLERERHRK